MSQDQGSDFGNPGKPPDVVINEDGDEICAGKIFIGGVSWQTSRETLRLHFEKFGEISDIAIMSDKVTGNPRGFGFVTFADPAVADKVVTQEHSIDGRTVDVKKAISRAKAPSPSRTSRTESKKLFVGGLSSEVTGADLEKFFSNYGQVVECVVMVDRKTNRSRGFGFVSFDSEEAVTACLATTHEIMGKWVEIKRAEPRMHDQMGRNSMMGGGGGFGFQMGNGMMGNYGNMYGAYPQSGFMMPGMPGMPVMEPMAHPANLSSGMGSGYGGRGGRSYGRGRNNYGGRGGNYANNFVQGGMYPAPYGMYSPMFAPGGGPGMPIPNNMTNFPNVPHMMMGVPEDGFYNPAENMGIDGAAAMPPPVPVPADSPDVGQLPPPQMQPGIPPVAGSGEEAAGQAGFPQAADPMTGEMPMPANGNPGVYPMNPNVFPENPNMFPPNVGVAPAAPPGSVGPPNQPVPPPVGNGYYGGNVEASGENAYNGLPNSGPGGNPMWN